MERMQKALKSLPDAFPGEFEALRPGAPENFKVFFDFN
jgi:hypothetical protein